MYILCSLVVSVTLTLFGFKLGLILLLRKVQGSNFDSNIPM